MSKDRDPRKIETRILDIFEETDNLKSKKLSLPAKTAKKLEGVPEMHLTFRDGFNFGCGFFVANLVAALMLGIVAFVFMIIATFIGAAGIASILPH